MDTLKEVRHALPVAAAAAPVDSAKGTEADEEPVPTPLIFPTREPDPQSLPCVTARAFTINGIRTDVWVQLFADRTVLACSQRGGRIGNWLLCKRTVIDPLFSGKADTHISHVLGAAQRDDPLLQVYARQVTEQIAAAQTTTTAGEDNSSPNTTTVVLLGLSLDPSTCKDPAVFRTLVQLLGKVYRDAIAMAASRE